MASTPYTMIPFPTSSPASADQDAASEDATRETAQVMTMAEARERSRRIKLARSLREGSYQPDLDSLATMLLDHPDFYNK